MFLEGGGTFGFVAVVYKVIIDGHNFLGQLVKVSEKLEVTLGHRILPEPL
jgi:hypothetical protein